jgi:hypothetical protein
MSYAVMISPCLICGLPFGYNPRLVPSLIDPKTKVMEPVCKHCMDRENSERTLEEDPKRPSLWYHPDAYQPINEEELP